jgi:hypothetical protein
MRFRSNLKKACFAAGAVMTLASLYLVYTVGGLASSEIVFDKPPAFVAEYVSDKYGINNTGTQNDATGNLTKDYFNEAALVRNIIVNGESPDELIRGFTSPDKATRVKMAAAFGEVNIQLSHDENSHFDQRRDEFWKKVKGHESAMQNALFEALIVSAQEQTRTYIPYTLAWWMQDDKSKTVNMLAWAAKHHNATWVRQFSLYYVAQFGGDEELAAEVIAHSTHDPVFRVRAHALSQRYRRLKEMIFGKAE